MVYLVILVSPLVKLSGYVEGYVSVYSYEVRYRFVDAIAPLPNMDYLSLIRQVLFYYMIALAVLSALAVVLAWRKPLDALALSYGIFLSLITVTGVLRMIVIALASDLKTYELILVAELVSKTLAGVSVTSGTVVEYTLVYKLLTWLLPLLSQPIVILLPLLASAVAIALFLRSVPPRLPTLELSKVASTFIVFFVLLYSGYSAVFACSTLQVFLYPVQPATYFVSISSPAQQSIGANGTSASVSVVQSNTIQLITNPGFNNGLSGWTSVAGTYLAVGWLSSDTGASGGVARISGNVPGNSHDEGYVYQEVRLPVATITSITITATTRYDSAPPASTVSYFIGLYDPSTGTWVASTTGNVNPNYKSASLSITAGVTPGKTYYVYVGVIVDTKKQGGPVDFRIDSTYMYVTTQEYSFSNALIGINSVRPAYAKLVLEAVSGNLGDLSAEIKIVNYNGASSTPISIVNGAVVSWETSWVELPIASAGYTSATIYLTSKSTTIISTTLNIYLVVSTAPNGGGTVVYYPLVVNIS